jgi:hypothetical protein
MFWVNKPIHNFSRNAPILSGKNQSDPKDFACSATNAIALYFFLNWGRSLSRKGDTSHFWDESAIAQPISKVKLFKENVS